MLTASELREWTGRLGVAEAQIRRDHLISHILYALPRMGTGPVTFSGGTALCRTHLLDTRVSEDLDLLVGSARAVEEAFVRELPTHLRREFPSLSMTWTSAGVTRVGRLAAGPLRVLVQLVPTDDGYRRYPTEQARVLLRYRDLPDGVALRVPSLVGFAAMKLNAWADRATPRDLCDLLALHRLGALDREAIAVAREVSAALQPQAFAPERLPNAEQWQAALGAQMATPPDRHASFSEVREHLAELCGWELPATEP